jgi:hypothetical protein
MLEYELDSSRSGYEPVAGSFEHGNTFSDSIKDGEFLNQLLHGVTEDEVDSSGPG